jgi:hypothetical protein
MRSIEWSRDGDTRRTLPIRPLCLQHGEGNLFYAAVAHFPQLRIPDSHMSMHRLLASAGRWIDRIKINELTRVTRDGRAYWLKRRRPGAGAIISVGNAFFRLAGNRVVILGRDSEWHAWEYECSSLLHGASGASHVDDTGWLWLPEFPGRSLSSHIEDGTAEGAIFAAAARELRRAHEFHSPTLSGNWSHGDPHSGNFIYDPVTIARS